MSGPLTRSAYQKLIDEDLAWLRERPRTLEREHVIAIVEQSVIAEYGPEPGCTGMSARWCPIHGDCACPEDGDDMNDPRCPLHAWESSHAEAERSAP